MPGQTSQSIRVHAALFCLGAWVMGTVCVSIVAMQNFYTIDRLLDGRSHEAFAGFAEDAGRETARSVLRYLSSELNRLFFQLWNGAQFAVGGAALWLVWSLPGAARLRALLVAMLLLVAFLTFWVTPQILDVGRSLDFVPRDPPPPGVATFGILHATYTMLELLKGAAALGAAVWVVRLAAAQRSV